MGEDEFERVVGEWAYSCLRKEKKYSNVALLGGSGDSGRDLVAYIDDNMQSLIYINVSDMKNHYHHRHI